MKMMNRNEIDEMIAHSGNQIVEHVRDEMGKRPGGIEPRDIFMNGALNVITSFLCSKTHDFKDREQVEIFNTTTYFMDRFMDYVVTQELRSEFICLNYKL